MTFSIRMGNLVSSRRHLVLLGDSTIDNGNWTPGLCVTDQVRALQSLATRCAKDGALIAAIPSQVRDAPKDATHYIVSVGGNNAISAVNILKEPTSSAEEAIKRISSFAKSFEEEFQAMVRNVVEYIGEGTPLVICSFYNPCFAPFNVTTVSQDVANTCVAFLADAVLRVATRFRAPVIDWRRVMIKIEDFANPIEPSSIGGLKMADAIVSVVRNHPFNMRTTVIYPQDYPDTEFLCSSVTEGDAGTVMEGSEVPTSVLDIQSSAAVVNDIRPQQHKDQTLE